MNSLDNYKLATPPLREIKEETCDTNAARSAREQEQSKPTNMNSNEITFYVSSHGALYGNFNGHECIITGVQQWITSIDQEPHLILV